MAIHWELLIHLVIPCFISCRLKYPLQPKLNKWCFITAEQPEMHHFFLLNAHGWSLCCRVGRYAPVARSTTKEPLRRSAASHSRTPSGAFGDASVGPVGKGKEALHRGRLRRGAVSLCAGLKCRACKAVLVERHLQTAQISASVQLNTAGCSCQLAWMMQAALAPKQKVHSGQTVAR